MGKTPRLKVKRLKSQLSHSWIFPVTGQILRPMVWWLEEIKVMQSQSRLQIMGLAVLLQTAVPTSLVTGLAPVAPARAAQSQHLAAKTIEVKTTPGGGTGDADATPVAPKRDYTAPVLADLAVAYKQTRYDLSFGKYFSYLRDLLVNPDFWSANPSDLVAANPSLSDLHVKVTETGLKNMRVWSFPSLAESHAVILSAPGKTTAIPLPLSVVLREARVIPSSFASVLTKPGTPKVMVKGRGKSKIGTRSKSKLALRPVAKRTAASAALASEGSLANLAAFGKYLVLIGGDRQTNMVWLKGFKLTDGQLVEAPELFASLPAFFSQNVSGKASFSGSDIVLTIQPPTSSAPKDSEEKAEVVIQANGKALPIKTAPSAVAGYKVLLKYTGGKFGLSGNLPDDAPLSVALSFAQNIAAGHPDLAKAWLADPKMISLPKYLGLIGHSTPPMRLVAMSRASGARYRLITSVKDDLIIDVGRVLTPGKLKGQLAIKAIFVAPPDPYAAKFTGTIVTPAALKEEGDDTAAGAKAGTATP